MSWATTTARCCSGGCGSDRLGCVTAEPARDERRVQLRAQLRLLHPDVGGDPARFREVLAAYRALPSATDTRDYRGEVRFVARPHRTRTILGACAHPIRTLARLRSDTPPRVR